jgi:hypothetical protein
VNEDDRLAGTARDHTRDLLRRCLCFAFGPPESSSGAQLRKGLSTSYSMVSGYTPVQRRQGLRLMRYVPVVASSSSSRS